MNFNHVYFGYDENLTCLKRYAGDGSQAQASAGASAGWQQPAGHEPAGVAQVGVTKRCAAHGVGVIVQAAAFADDGQRPAAPLG